MRCFLEYQLLEKLDWHHVTFSESVKKEMQYANRGKVLSWCGECPDQPFSKYAVAFRLLNGTALKAVRIVANPNGRLASERLTDVDHSNLFTLALAIFVLVLVHLQHDDPVQKHIHAPKHIWSLFPTTIPHI